MGRSARGPLTRAGIRVEPTSDHMRNILKHPRAGGFRSSGAVTWPDDIFTRRRIRDGDVKIVEEKKEAKKAEASSKTPSITTTA
jgi:hypothetical protein